MKQSIKRYLHSAILVVFSSAHLIASDASLPVAYNAVTNNYTPLDYSDKWKFQLAPMFLWGMNMNGVSQIGPAAAPLDLNFKDDVLENLSMVFTIHFEAHKGDWGVFSEYQYVGLEPSSTQEVPPITTDTKFTNEIFELGGTYTFVRTDKTKWEALAGLRYTSQDNHTKVNGISVVDVTENWTDFFIGTRNYTKLSEKWAFIGRADIGAGGSDMIWNVALMADYRVNEWCSVFIGYKWMDYDYDNGKTGADTYTYDVLQQGPLLGLNIHW